MTVRDKIFSLINNERAYQDNKWDDGNSRSIAHYLLVMRKELQEAEDGWMKNKSGRNSAVHEILQVISVGVAALEEHYDEFIQRLE